MLMYHKKLTVMLFLPHFTSVVAKLMTLSLPNLTIVLTFLSVEKIIDL